MKARIRMLRVHAKGRGFSYDLFAFRAIPDAQHVISSLNERKRLSLCPLLRDYRLSCSGREAENCFIE
jgi:hypothetical protein